MSIEPPCPSSCRLLPGADPFPGLRTKIDAHFGASPLIKQRAEFLAVGPSTPLDRKVKFTPEVVGAAAAYESWKAFERDPAHRPADGSKLAHARGKQVGPHLPQPSMICQTGK